MKKFTLALFLIIPASYSVDLGRGLPFDYLHVHAAPDPVNARNGNFYLPLPDYYQSCFGFPLEVYRSYNSFSTRNGPFGIGWTFNYDIQIVVGEKNGLQIIEPDGFVNQYISVNVAEQDPNQVIQKIIEAKKVEDISYMKNKEGKGTPYYKDLEQKLRKDPEFLKRQKERYLISSASSSSSNGKYVSFARGTTYITKTSAGYTRSSASGQDETYDLDGNITRITDRNGNELRFNYDKSRRLDKVLDSCGNYLNVSYNAGGKISKIADSFSQEMKYTYNDGLQLVASLGTDKQTIEYTYDKLTRMDSVFFKEDGSKTLISYDPKTGRVISQEGPGKKKTTYEYNKIGGTISTRIKDNQGENTLFEYMDQENKIAQTDASNVKTTTVLSECCGKPVLIETTQGVHDTFEYDKDGNLISKTDAKGQKTFFEYEPRFLQPSEIRDGSGEIIRYRYDQKGNLTFAKKTSASAEKEPSPADHSTSLKISYEDHGKISNITDDVDQEIRFTYSKIGKPTSIELWKSKRKTSEIRVQYTDDGTMSNLEYVPNNPETANMIKETLKSYLLLLKPAGIDFEI